MWDEKRKSIENDITKASSEVAILVNGEKGCMAIPYLMMPSDLIDYLVIFVDSTLPIKSLLFIGIGPPDIYVESRSFLAKEHITKRGNPMPERFSLSRFIT